MAEKVTLQLRLAKPGSKTVTVLVERDGLQKRVSYHGKNSFAIYPLLTKSQRKSLRDKGKCNISVPHLISVVNKKELL